MARPRQFDVEHVLEQTMLTFWQKGYEGTSLADLLKATGLNKSSLYSAFTDKETLFRLALDRYQRNHLGFRDQALAMDTPRRIVEHLLYGMVGLHTGPQRPRGCFETNALLACSDHSEALRTELASGRAGIRVRLRERFEATAGTVPLPAGMSADSAALYVATLIQGLAVQSKGGATAQEMNAVVGAFLANWPEKPA